ncbi:MAG: cupin domain-containing protein [Proteobacteria bacterium]|nr:cupin domain-containing protein [Pseudomonadota bacterium]
MSRLPVEAQGRHRQPLGMSPARFLREYWQKRPLLVRNAFPDFVPPLSGDDLAGLACMDGVLARIVTHDPKRNRWKLAAGPFDDAVFAKLPASHWTLLVQDVDKWDADVAALLDRFGFLPSWRIDDVMASYATDGGGVGAHVDQYDVFLLQGAGRRRWRIDTDSRASREFRDDVELKLLREFRPSREWTLAPGDLLYLPPDVPHEGVAIGECMTFSIGMRAPSKAELLVAFAETVAMRLPESRRYADPGLRPARRPGEIDAAALRRARAALGPAAQMLDAEGLADFFGRFVTAYRTSRPAIAPKRKADAVKLAAELPRSVFERDPWSRFAWRRTARGAVLYVSGEPYRCPPAWAQALCGPGRALAGARLAELPARGAGVTLLAELLDAGFLVRKRS